MTFTSCGDTKVVTVTPVAAGSTRVTLGQTSNTTGGSFNLSPATFDVVVSAATPTNTAPTVDVVDVEAGKAYEFGAVPVARCSVTDAEDGPYSFDALLSAVTGPLSSIGLGSQTASCDYTDDGGLTASSSVTYAIVDTTNPVITYVGRTDSNDAKWNNSDVTLTWTCWHSLGVVSETVTETVETEGAGQSATGTCTDVAGNTASDTQSGINIDKTAPTISATLAPALPASHWWNVASGAPTVTYTCSDDLSGIVACPEPHTFGEGADQSAQTTVSDLAGNSASAGVDNVDVDLTAPLQRCSYPGQLTIGTPVNTRAGPGTTYAVNGSLQGGALAYVACQKSGTLVGTTRVWNQLADGRWLSDYYVSNASNTTFSAPVPRCP